MDTSDRQSAPILMMSILEKAHYLPIFFCIIILGIVPSVCKYFSSSIQHLSICSWDQDESEA